MTDVSTMCNITRHTGGYHSYPAFPYGNAYLNQAAQAFNAYQLDNPGGYGYRQMAAGLAYDGTRISSAGLDGNIATPNWRHVCRSGNATCPTAPLCSTLPNSDTTSECFVDYMMDLATASLVLGTYQLPSIFGQDANNIVLTLAGTVRPGPAHLQLPYRANPACDPTCAYDIDFDSMVLQVDMNVIPVADFDAGNAPLKIEWDTEPECATIPAEPCNTTALLAAYADADVDAQSLSVSAQANAATIDHNAMYNAAVDKAIEDANACTDPAEYLAYVFGFLLILVVLCAIFQATAWQRERMIVARREKQMHGPETSTVFIKCFSGDIHDLEISSDLTISEVKAMIEKVRIIPLLMPFNRGSRAGTCTDCGIAGGRNSGRRAAFVF